MKHIEQLVELSVPVRVAYNQWTQFEEFPRFMPAVKRVNQLDAKALRWSARIGGKTVQWNALITEQIPDVRIVWQSTTGTESSGRVSFAAVGPGRSTIRVSVDYAPRGMLERIGTRLGMVEALVAVAMENFKRFIETRGCETGAWRDEIRAGYVLPATRQAG